MLIHQPIAYPFANWQYPQLTDDVPEEPLYYPFWDEKDESAKWGGWIANEDTDVFVKYVPWPYGFAESTDSHIKTVGLFSETRGVLCGEEVAGENYFIPAGQKLVFKYEIRNTFTNATYASVANMKIEALESEIIIGDYSYSSMPSGRVIYDADLSHDAGASDTLWQFGCFEYECEADTYGLAVTATASGGSGTPNVDVAHAFCRVNVESGISGNELMPYPYFTNDNLLYEKS